MAELKDIKIMTPEEYDQVVEQIGNLLRDIMLRAPYKASQLVARDMEREVKRLERG